MENIKNLLERINTIKPPDFNIRESARDSIKEVLGEDVDIKGISVKGRSVHVEGGASFKSEVFLNKRKIVEKLKEKLPNISIEDIN